MFEVNPTREFVYRKLRKPNKARKDVTTLFFECGALTHPKAPGHQVEDRSTREFRSNSVCKDVTTLVFQHFAFLCTKALPCTIA